MIEQEPSLAGSPVARLLRLLVFCALVAPIAAQAMSPKRAFLYSLLVPGWGQYVAGNEKSAVRFLGAELGLWGGFFAFKKVEDVRVDNYRSYAAQHAQAQTSSKNSQYFDDLGFYSSRLQHNRFARYDDGPNANIYPETADFFWEWDSEASRNRYKELLNSSDSAQRQSLLFSGLVVVNHLVSAIHAARNAGRHQQTSNLHALDVEIAAQRHGFGVILTKPFR
jgi:hypothetical protein